MKYSCLGALVLLTGCAISPGPLTDREFIETTIPVSHDTALANLRKGWEVCNNTVYGRPSFVFFEDRTDVDIQGVTPWFKDVSDIPIGRIEILRLNDQRVKVRAGIHRNFINGQRRQNWLKWASGNYVCEWQVN